MTFFDDLENVLMHYGTPRHSGRYPWGSGENPYQHTGDFMSRVDEMRAANFEWDDPETGKHYTGDTAIAKSMGLSTTQFRTQLSLAKDERRTYLVQQVKSMKSDGLSNSEIARQLGFNSESSVRALLNENAESRMNKSRVVADYLKQMVDEKGMIDVGAGVEREIGDVSPEKLKEALYILELEGYPVYGGRIQQPTNPDQGTTLKVLCPPGTEHKDIYQYDQISSVKDYDMKLVDDGMTMAKRFEYPESMDSSRLQICYAEDGGKDKDGVIELRRGVEDLSLGDSHYAQVRILVDGTHYLKGMALYSDDLPDGVDVRFNTNKTSDISKMDVLKAIKKDPDNPFGSLIKENGGQSYYEDENGKYIKRDNKYVKITDGISIDSSEPRYALSLINKRSEEGDWGSWSDVLPSQFLAKQNKKLIENQLKLGIADKKAEFESIMELTNPTVKRSLLESFADECDYTSVHLEAAALPRQKYKVILPLTKIKDNEVYAPSYHDGETVALIRYPHGGTFEIPILTVNNKLKQGIDILGKTPADAIGINSKVAERLSGADFDGDTVMVIPCNSKYSNVRITSTAPLISDFDPKLEYGCDPTLTKKTTRVDKNGKTIEETHYYRNGVEFKQMKNTQNEMGKISNLITDMTLLGADEKELARAVKHSMVVIDAEKHHLDYKASEADNQIASLKKKYQGHTDENGKYSQGVATLISRAKSPVQVNKAVGQTHINQKGKGWYDETKPEGSLIFNRPEQTYVDKKGRTRVRTQESTRMAETDDATTLISTTNTPQERLYAWYANTCKAMANEARKELVSTGTLKYNTSAAKTYEKEVSSLNAKLNRALLNAPKEREAIRIATSRINAKTKGVEDLSKKEIKKIKQQEMTKARDEVGAHREKIDITDKEWEAIQAGAISDSKLVKILNNADTDKLRELATPRKNSNELRDAQKNKIKQMKNSGYTLDEIATAIGCSSSTVSKYLK